MGYIRCMGGGGGSFQELNNINTWLKLGGVSGTYSSLSDILADTTALTKLMTTKNSVDYLIGCDDFIAEICASSNGMSAIGVSNYCANSLLPHNNWFNGIVNSEYFESVLNVKVPTMTSDTTPSGECFGSSSLSSDYWKAFRNTYTTSDNGMYWLSAANDTNPWLAYDFGRAITLKSYFQRRIYAKGTSNLDILTCKIQGSNDKTTWNDISSTITVNNNPTANEKTSANFMNNIAYRYYRLYTLTKRGTGSILITQLQFYGREDI